MTELAPGTEGRRPKASRGGNRGQGHVGCAAITYGDLIAAGERSRRRWGRCNAAVELSTLGARLAVAEWRASKDEERPSLGDVLDSSERRRGRPRIGATDVHCVIALWG